MRELFKKFFRKQSQKTGFSEFFRDASVSDKKELLERVVREANKDQRDLVDEYNRIHSKSVY